MLKKVPTKLTLIDLFDSITELAQENYNNISPHLMDITDEKDYFFGIIQRALIFSMDISNILKYARHKYYTSIFIIGRCVYDDFITLMYIDSYTNKEEAINCLNASAKKHQLNKLNELAELNEKYYNNAFPFYTTKEQLKEIRKKFAEKKGTKNYLKNPENINPDKLEFKSFPSTNDIVNTLNKQRENDLIGRAYYFWRQWSDYVHFSPHSFHIEQEAFSNPEDEINVLRSIQEMGAMLTNSIKVSLRYFYQEHAIAPLDTKRVVHQVLSVSMS